MKSKHRAGSRKTLGLYFECLMKDAHGRVTLIQSALCNLHQTDTESFTAQPARYLSVTQSIYINHTGSDHTEHSPGDVIARFAVCGTEIL